MPPKSTAGSVAAARSRGGGTPNGAIRISASRFGSASKAIGFSRPTASLQDFLHLQKTKADACRLTVFERLGTDEENATHARPFIRSTISCSFQVRDL